MIDAGHYVYSKTRHHADDPGLPIGGVVFATLADADGEIVYKIVAVHRGRPEYHLLAADDASPGLSGEHVRTDVLRDLLVQLSNDEVRSRDPLKHNDCRVVLAGVLARHSPARRSSA